MDLTADNLEKAVLLFYQCEAGQQAEAHQWLSEAQESPQAWSFVWDLLVLNRSSEVQFFAASTLHTKVLKHWNEVPPDHYEILKKKILESIISFANGPKIVLNRLCITLAAYVLHTIPTHWPTAFEDIVSSFQSHNLPNISPEQVSWILLEILTVIPEELQNMNIGVRQRFTLKLALNNVSVDILKIIEMFLSPHLDESYKNRSNTYLNASRCALGWVQLEGADINDCKNLINSLIEVTCYTYWNKHGQDGLSCDDMELIEASTEALSSALAGVKAHKYPTLIISHLGTILEKFLKIIDVECSKVDANKDVICSIFNLIISVSDTHSKQLTNSMTSDNQLERDIALCAIRAILTCASLPGCYPVDENSSTLTFGFWYDLQDDIFSLEKEKRNQCLAIIQPYYRELVSIMLRKSMLPASDDDPNWTADDREMFRCYRQDIADTIMYCYNVLKIEFLDILSSKLNEAIADCCQGDEVIFEKWPYIESCLHAFCAVAEHIDVERLHLPELMNVLKRIPYNHLHMKLLAAALDTVGAYSEWISNHPEMLENVVHFLTAALMNPDVAPSATMALKDLTNYCERYMAPFGNHILQTCQTALQSGLLKLRECTRIMFSMGQILSFMEPSYVMEYLNVILTPYFEELQLLLPKEQTETVATTIITRLKMLSSLFSSLQMKQLDPKTPSQQQQPIFVVVQTTLPLYRELGSKWCRNSEIMEVLCKLLMHAIVNLMDEAKPLANEVAQLLVSCYKECPQPSVINIATTIIQMFAKDDDMTEPMQAFMCELANASLQMCMSLTEGGVNRLSEKTDVLESFFNMMSRVCKRNAKMLLAPGLDMSGVFQCGVICLSVQESQTCKVCAQFLVSFILHSREINLSYVVQNFGEQLIIRIMINLGGATPRSAVEPMSEILFSLSKKYSDSLARWLATVLMQENFPSPRIARQQKENFIRHVLKERASKQKLSEVTLEFTLICRGILQPENRP